MKQLTLREVQLEELKILIYFDDFCRKYDLRYSLVYGTLIGAARHKGFIPWDDDIDVAMPRPGYEKLLKLNGQFDNETIKLIADELNHSLDATYAAAINMHLPCKNTYSSTKRSRYLWIDIFPVDGFSDANKTMEVIYRKSQRLQAIMTLASARLGKGKTIFHRLAKLLVVPLCRLYGIQRCLNQMDALAKSFPYETSRDVGVIAWGEGTKERLSRKEFEKMDEIEFEGHMFKVMACWRKYLKNMYGDYTQLPPVKERGGHNIIAYRR